MDKKEQMMTLMVKIGVFFAKCDGYYDLSECEFMTNYIKLLSENEHISEKMISMLHETADSDYTIEEILKSTDDLLEGFTEHERTAILSTIKDFIVKLINADGVVDKNEQTGLNQWSEYFGV